MNFDLANKKVETDLRMKVLKCPDCLKPLKRILYSSKEGIYYYACDNKDCYLSLCGFKIVSAKFKDNNVFFPIFEIERNTNTKLELDS